MSYIGELADPDVAISREDREDSSEPGDIGTFADPADAPPQVALGQGASVSALGGFIDPDAPSIGSKIPVVDAGEFLEPDD